MNCLMGRYEPRLPEGGRGLFGWDGFLACRIAGVVAFVWVITPGYYFLIVFVQYVSLSYEASLGALYEARYNVSFHLG